MTLVDRPIPPAVGRPELAVPAKASSSCTCRDPGLELLWRLMAGGMGQWAASQMLWGGR